MITKLDNSNREIARLIHVVFQNAYKVEALLIGVEDFPPLSRNLNSIQSSKTDFYGFHKNNELAAVIELEFDGNKLSIDSLTVSPDFFRLGIAGKLMTFVLRKFSFSTAVVETAVLNSPAIRLYEKHGFTEFKRWTPSHGIEKLALSVSLKG